MRKAEAVSEGSVEDVTRSNAVATMKGGDVSIAAVKDLGDIRVLEEGAEGADGTEHVGATFQDVKDKDELCLIVHRINSRLEIADVACPAQAGPFKINRER